MMQISLKSVIAAVLAAGAAVAGTAAQAATITNIPSTPGGSDLVLFVSDPTSNQFFVEDLGVGINSTVTAAQVTAASTTDGSFVTPTSIASLGGPSSALHAFLTSTTVAADVTAGNVSYSILASDATTSAVALGSERALVTSTNDLSLAGGGTTFGNGDVKTFGSQSKVFFNAINTSYAGGNTSTSLGWGTGGVTTQATNAPISWVSASIGNGATIGTTQTMYLLATNGTGSGSNANVYIGGTIDIDAAGNITVTNAGGGGAPVPLPAAVWLLGSGILGLVGVGRRRRATAA